MGIFASNLDARKLFSLYRTRLEFRDKLLGGISGDPNIIEGWLRAKAGIQAAEEARHAILRTMLEMGADVTDDMTLDDAIAASKKLATTDRTQGFKTDPLRGLYIESRYVKAALKEVVNILYAGQRIGATKKGPKSYTAERVFVSPSRLFLERADPTTDVTDPDGVLLMISHVTGPAGPRNALSYHQYVERASIEFTVMVAEDGIPNDWWPRLWTLAEMNGIGAVRSQGHGTFDVVRWDKLGVPSQEEYERIIHEDAIKLSDQPLPAKPQPAPTNGHVTKVEVRKSRASVLVASGD